MRLIDADALIQYMNDQKISFNADVNEAILNARTIGNYAEYVDRVCEIAYERGKEEALQWIPCSRELPKEDEEVLVYLYGKVPYLAYIDSKGQWNTEYFTIGEYHSPLAWMPLPEPYGGDENE